MHVMVMAAILYVRTYNAKAGRSRLPVSRSRQDVAAPDLLASVLSSWTVLALIQETLQR